MKCSLFSMAHMSLSLLCMEGEYNRYNYLYTHVLCVQNILVVCVYTHVHVHVITQIFDTCSPHQITVSFQYY